MRKYCTALVFFGAILSASGAKAQKNPCLSNIVYTPFQAVGAKAASTSVACTVPQVYSENGLYSDATAEAPVLHLQLPGNPLTGATIAFNDFLTPLNKDIATSIALLPVVSPAAGISFIFDPSLGVFSASTDGFGPIFSERASTIGRHRLSIGASYQYQSFSSLDGVNLRTFPTVYLQQLPNPSVCNSDPNETGQCSGLRDYLVATNRIDLKIQQINTFLTFGVTRKMDISIAVPLMDIRMAATADTRVVLQDDGFNFLSLNSSQLFPCATVTVGQLCLHQIFSNAQHAFGVGDITLRAKLNIKNWEHAGFAAGIDVRIPNGDSLNFLGSGTIGIRPFVVWSRGGRISPHVNLGYQWNGKSILAQDITTGTKGSLPGDLLYSVGAEAAVVRRLTATFDLVGQRLFGTSVDSLTQVQVPGDRCGICSPAVPAPDYPVTTIASSMESYGINNAALGVRLNPFGRLLISANVQLRLDNGGLRSKAIPLISATYTFH